MKAAPLLDANEETTRQASHPAPYSDRGTEPAYIDPAINAPKDQLEEEEELDAAREAAKAAVHRLITVLRAIAEAKARREEEESQRSEKEAEATRAAYERELKRREEEEARRRQAYEEGRQRTQAFLMLRRTHPDMSVEKVFAMVKQLSAAPTQRTPSSSGVL